MHETHPNAAESVTVDAATADAVTTDAATTYALTTEAVTTNATTAGAVTTDATTAGAVTTDAAAAAVRTSAGRASRAGGIVDLSHDIRAGLVTYPGLPAPVITPHLTRAQSREHYAPGTEFAMDLITLIGNTGTYLDSPFHRYEGGTDLAGLPLESLVDLPAEVFHVTGQFVGAASRGIGAEALAGRDLAGSAVLLHTGWDRHFGEPAYATGAPFLTASGARFLVDAGVALVGIDSLNIDDTESGGARPAHSLLLAAGIHVVEHLTNLGELPSHGTRFTAVPPKIVGFGTFPVRAFARF